MDLFLYSMFVFLTVFFYFPSNVPSPSSRLRAAGRGGVAEMNTFNQDVGVHQQGPGISRQQGGVVVELTGRCKAGQTVQQLRFSEFGQRDAHGSIRRDLGVDRRPRSLGCA